MTHWRHSITGRTLLLLAAAVGLIIVVATGVTYLMVFRAAERREVVHLNQYTTERAGRLEQYCAEIKRNLATAHDAYIERYRQPDPPDYLALWDRYFEHNADGAWRSKREYSDDYKYAPLWARKNIGPSADLKRRVLVMFEVCQKFLPGWVHGFRSLYGFTNDEMSVIGFDPALAGWVYDQDPDYDITTDEFGLLDVLATTPRGKVGWTGTTSDVSSGHSLVSAILPVEIDGRHVITVAHDMWVDELIAETTRAQIPGLTHMLFREDGRMIAYPDRAAEIYAGKGQLNMATADDPTLNALYAAVRGRPEPVFGGYDPVSKNYYAVHRIPGPDWYYLTKMPLSVLRQQAFESARWVLWSALASLGLQLVLLGVILRRGIERPVAELVAATRRVAAGETELALPSDRTDELGVLARAFNEMARNIRDRDEALRNEKTLLEDRVAQRTRAQARFASILDLSPDFVGICDMEQRVVYVNRAGRQLLNLPADGALDGIKVADFHPAWAAKVVAETALPTALREGIWTGEAALREHTGREIPVSAAIIILRSPDGTPEFGATIMRDLTERQRTQEKLERALERERELVQLKSNFVSLVSHEFRTPLGIIGSSAQILDRYLPRLGEEERHEHLENINVSVKRMAAMMEDMLVLSRVDSGRMEFTPTPLALGDFCRRLLDELLSAHGGDTALEVAPDAEPPAPADENLLRHVLNNLLTNAHKYSPPGAPVKLTLTREGHDAVFAVRDEGIGIPEKDQARLFEAFHRGANVGQVNGTGLGLVIVRRCCELHGGTVAVASREDAGTTFTVRLPVFAP